MTRVVQKKGETKAYVCVVADYKKDDKWHQVVLMSGGVESPVNRARALTASVLLDLLDAELRAAPAAAHRAELEREVVRLIGADAVLKLRKLIAGGGNA